MDNKFLNFFKFDGILDVVKGYVDAKIQLVKLDIKEKASKVITTLLFMVLLLFSFLMMVVFGSLALGHYLNTLFHSEYLGFVVLALFFFMIVLIMAFNVTKGFLHKKIRNMLLEIMSGKKK
ncbi:MAG: phage holin family protein [Cytophagaceae bacterium]